MRNCKSLRQFADRDIIAAGKSLDGQQGLVLLRRQPGGPCRLLAEAQEPAQGVAQAASSS